MKKINVDKKVNTEDIPQSCKRFIDIHCHVLPAIDDGPHLIKETKRMLKKAWKEGVVATIATPHLLLDKNTDDTMYLARKKAVTAKRYIRKRGLNLSLFLGYEIMASERMIYYDDLQKFCMANSKCILVEAEVTAPLHWMNDLLFEARLQGLGIIIAHPERYLWFAEKPKYLSKLVENGALLQVNTQSITGASGSLVKKRAKKYCQDGLVSFVATDAHAASGRRGVCVKEAIKTLLTWIPQDQVEKIIRENAKELILGKDGMYMRGDR